MNERTVRIFISSPGDVHVERERARGVVQQLRRRYAGRLDLQAVLWEELPLNADSKFQDGIDMVLIHQPVDIAVFILWSRLGSPTGPLMRGDEGKQYRSGTEREWDLMLQARQQCEEAGEPPRPALLVYTRRDDVSFEERLRGKPDDIKFEELQQKRLVTEFITEEFRDAESGVNLRAHHNFDQPTTFAQRLRVHLTAWLDDLAGDDLRDPVWNIDEQGPPFRGLEAFEFEHAPVFFGREDETVSLRTRLREQACQGCAFVLVSGPSGSGKSSLARAGLLPDVCHYELDNDIRQWRWLAVKPSQLGADLLGGLVTSLMAENVLPELRQWSADLTSPQHAESVRDWLTRFGMRVRDALQAAGSTRLILLVDQLEELFIPVSQTEEPRPATVIGPQHLFAALEVLARSGLVWVVATVRSDFYADCQKFPALMQMKEGGGQFDLMPPTPDALSRVITGPAQLAGLRFETSGEQTLADFILREAAEHKELLPLVEHLLLKLCEANTEGKLTFAEFRRLGGVEGALRQHCEETFAGVKSPQAQAALETVLPELVSLSGAGEEKFVRRSVPLAQFKSNSPERELIDSLVNARLCTATSGAAGVSTVSVAHEALLRVWPRIANWINDNREFLRLRATVEHAHTRWQAQGQETSLLLPAGLPLEEARRLLELGSQRLSPALTEYIESSITAHAQAQQRANQRRRMVIGVLSLATVISLMLGLYAWHQADVAKTSELKANNATLAATAAGKTADEKRAEAVRERDNARKSAAAAIKARASEQAALKTAETRRQEAEETAANLEATLARSNYFLATARWNEGRVSEARKLLQGVPQKHRNIEWYLDQRMFQGSHATLYGHKSRVGSVAFSPDGTRIVSGSWDHTLKLWDAASGQELRTLAGHTSYVGSVAFSPDGTRIVSGSGDNTLKLWDAASGQELRTLARHTDDVTTVAFSPDGTRVVSGSGDNTLKLWDAASGQELRTLAGHIDDVDSVAFNPDGTRIVSRDDFRKQIAWNSKTGLPVEEPANWEIAETHRSPDGGWLEIPQGNDVGIVDLHYKQQPRERAFLESKARPNPWWHVEQAKAAEQASNWYAAMFHWAWVLKGSEALGKGDDEYFTGAATALQGAHAKWLAEQTPADPDNNNPTDPNRLLPPAVREMLADIEAK